MIQDSNHPRPSISPKTKPINILHIDVFFVDYYLIQIHTHEIKDKFLKNENLFSFLIMFQHV